MDLNPPSELVANLQLSCRTPRPLILRKITRADQNIATPWIAQIPTTPVVAAANSIPPFKNSKKKQRRERAIANPNVAQIPPTPPGRQFCGLKQNKLLTVWVVRWFLRNHASGGPGKFRSWTDSLCCELGLLLPRSDCSNWKDPNFAPYLKKESRYVYPAVPSGPSLPKP